MVLLGMVKFVGRGVGLQDCNLNSLQCLLQHRDSSLNVTCCYTLLAMVKRCTYSVDINVRRQRV